MTDKKSQKSGSPADDQNPPLWKEVVQRLASPRIWFYPILALLLALFLLPRLAERSHRPVMNPVPAETSRETDGKTELQDRPASQTDAGFENRDGLSSSAKTK